MRSAPIPVPEETPMENSEKKKKRRSTVRGLADEAKNRMMLLLICAFILAYLMSCTSSSLWVNLPVAALLIIFLRYLSLDHGIRKDSDATVRQASVDNIVTHENSRRKYIDLPKFLSENSNWRRKVNCPIVEEAIEHFTRHLISEWVTDLWYSRITPDKDSPEELVQIVNDALGEISSRARDVNLINLLTRDAVNLLHHHLDLYRQTKTKIEQQQKKELANLPVEHRDVQVKIVLAAESRLHPGLFSGEAEHKVLQHLMAGVISFTFKPEDLQCSFFQYTARELLACAVMRPILNLINPRIINEKIESLGRSFTNKTAKGITGTPSGNPNEPSRLTASQLAEFQDRSAVGVELVQVKQDSVNRNSDKPSRSNAIGNPLSEHSVHSYPRLIADSAKDNSQEIAVHKSGGEWAYKLDAISRRKEQSLSPEHLDNMWVQGRDYKNKESAKFPTHNSAVGVRDVLETKTVTSGFKIGKPNLHSNGNSSSYTTTPKIQDVSHELDQEGIDTESSYSSDSDDNNNVMGLDSPGTKVWDSKTKTKVSRIRHPLETSDAKLMKKSGRNRVFNSKIPRAKRRHRLSNKKLPMWQETERPSYSKDVTYPISTSKENVSNEEMSDDSEFQRRVRTSSRSATSSSMPQVPETSHCSTRSSKSFMLDDSFLKLRCEVVGANIVKCGSGTFTVYSIAVTDADNNSWSIKRRFRHFEELHRLMKDFLEYSLSLPPKYFLSSGLDATIVRERCILLDKYLKKLLQLPTVSRSIEVWDFLSVDSQTYMFSDSLSVIQTLPVVHDDKLNIQNNIDARGDHRLPTGEHLAHTKKQSPNNSSLIPGSSKLAKKIIDHHLSNASTRNVGVQQDISGTNSEKDIFLISGIPERLVGVPVGESVIPQDKPNSIIGPVADEAINSEGVPLNKNLANLSAPILDLVDVIFHLQDGGWIRRQAFWVAKQVLQLGMGDAFDDWLIEKIQLLRRGSFVASMIQRIEQILWPDGIFITKHPNRRRPTQQSSPKEEGNSKNNRKEDLLTYEQQVEASRCAEFVHELIIDKAPVALVGLVGRKEYERCAEDIYNFLQSPVCLKHLAFELLELLLLSIYPELDDIVKQYHKEKEQFGKLEEQ